MTNKTCTQDEFNCIRPISKLVIGPQLCDLCYEYASWENTHTDERHEESSENHPIRDECPVCHPELDNRQNVRKSNTNAAGKHFDHSQCEHEATKSARAKCRKQMRDSKTVGVPYEFRCPTCDANVSKGEKCMTRTGKIAKQSHSDRPNK